MHMHTFVQTPLKSSAGKIKTSIKLMKSIPSKIVPIPNIVLEMPSMSSYLQGTV